MKLKNKMKKLVQIFMSMFFLLVLSLSVQAQNLPTQSEETTDGFIIEVPSEWQAIIESAPMTASEFENTPPENLIEILLEYVADKFLEPLRLFARLCAVIILVALAKSFVTHTTQSEIMNVLDLVATLTVFTICSSHILQLTSTVQRVIEDGNIYISSFIPVFATVLISSGQVSTSAIYSGVFFTVCSMITSFFVGVILPLNRVMLAMHATASVDLSLDLSKFAYLVSRWIKWTLTIISALFVAVLGLQTTLANNADTAALKAGKFLLGSTIPVVGRAVSDAMGSVLAGLKLVKGTMGFAAIATVMALLIPVIVQCFAYYLIFTLSGFIAGSTGNIKVEKMFAGFSSCVGIFITVILLFGAMITVATSMMIVIGTGG